MDSASYYEETLINFYHNKEYDSIDNCLTIIKLDKIKCNFNQLLFAIIKNSDEKLWY